MLNELFMRHKDVYKFLLAFAILYSEGGGCDCSTRSHLELIVIATARCVLCASVVQMWVRPENRWRRAAEAAAATAALFASRAPPLSAGAALVATGALALAWAEAGAGGYGAGMACNYVEGYLRRVLPGMRDAAVAWCSDNGVAVCPRLLIVVPRSLYCAADLAEWSASIQACRAPAPLVADVAGVKRRTYRSSVYRVSAHGRRPRYVFAECATPLYTLYSVKQRTAMYATIGVTATLDIDSVVDEFLRVLQATLDADSSCRGKACLVHYDDTDPSADFAELMLRHMPPEHEDLQP